MEFYSLTVILLDPKGISHSQQNSTRPVCTSMQSDQTLSCGRPTSSPYLDIPNYDNELFQNWKMDYSIMKLSRLRANNPFFKNLASKLIWRE